MTDFAPRTYADLLALADAAPVYVGGPARPAVLRTAEENAATPQAGPAASPAPAGPPTTAQIRAAEIFTEQQIVDSLQIVVLGTVGESKTKIFSRYHRKTVTISAVSRMQYEDLLQFAGTPVRSRVHDAGNGGDIPTGMHSLKDVKRAIALLAGFRTITEGGEVGSGCWAGLSEDGKTHDSVVIVGNSEAADWNGDKTLRRIEQPIARGRLLSFDQAAKNWYEFDDLSSLMKQASDPAFRIRAMNDCIMLLNNWRWKNPVSDPIVLTGLIFASWVQTLWDWRPIVSVVGPTNSGKSTFIKTLMGIFGTLGKSCSDQTAAGVRQLIESSARILMLDEFDAEDKAKAEEMGRILKMLRASGRGDSIVRGTAGQKAHEFVLRHLVWVLGIQIGTQRQADKNRLISAELRPPVEEMKNKLVVPDEATLGNLGQRMLATAIYCIHDARKLASKMKDTRVPGVDSRIVESHAVPAAILSVIQGENEVDARATLELMLKPLSQEESAGGSDEQALMETILAAHIQIGPKRLSVGQIIDYVIKDETAQYSDEYKTALESRGLRLSRFTGSEGNGAQDGEHCLLIAYSIIAEHLLKTTKWSGAAIDQILKRIRRAVVTRRRVGGQNPYVVGIPMFVLSEDFLGLGNSNLPGMDEKF